MWTRVLEAHLKERLDAELASLVMVVLRKTHHSCDPDQHALRNEVMDRFVAGDFGTSDDISALNGPRKTVP